MHIQFLVRILLPVILTGTFTGCSTTPATQSSQAKSSVQSPLVRAQKLLELAEQRQLPERNMLLLQAAQIYLANDQIARARALVVDINEENLSDSAYIIHSDIVSSIALQEGDNFLARDILTKNRLEQQWPKLDPLITISLHTKRAQVFALLGEAKKSISERIKLATLIKEKNLRQENQTALWRDLMTIEYSELHELGMRADSNVERGWYSLAALAKNNQSDLEQQREQLQLWRRDWHNHPAHDDLPSDLGLLQSLIDQQPKQIALLLPAQGKLAEASEAVRDGFFAAYYQALANGRKVPIVHQYDSGADVLSAYEKAVADGAELIIGPINKEAVTELSLMPSLQVPLLSLNYPDAAPTEPLKNFYQFGLAVEDEARQIARQAYLEGHRQAMVITPTQEWSERSARAFSEEWEALGGIIVKRSQFQPKINYSRLVKDAMLIEQSQIRAQELQSFLGIELKSLPRSRGDVDMIFLIADPAQARQIKPTFAFHFAGKIPVYATSQVYSGEENAKSDRDLNGIRFISMPWIFDNQNPERKSIAQHTKVAAVYGRLHALGADAFRLYPRLPQLAQAPQMRIYGATGALKMLPDGRIEREQIWAHFRNGKAQSLPTVINEDELQY